MVWFLSSCTLLLLDAVRPFHLAFLQLTSLLRIFVINFDFSWLNFVMSLHIKMYIILFLFNPIFTIDFTTFRYSSVCIRI
uniref:Uncharacterized protein n=1 Tax=Panstrongylus lignarius TaxID=156445 RepID=A0A224XZS9_9HEMI